MEGGIKAMLAIEERGQKFWKIMIFFNLATEILSFLYCSFLKVKTAVYNTENVST